MNSPRYAAKMVIKNRHSLVLVSLLVSSVLMVSGVLAGYSELCNSDNEYNTTCGGFNKQMILTCANVSGVFDWDSTVQYCYFGCINGTCVSKLEPCTDYCTLNETSCSGDYQIFCNDTDSDGCNDWTDFNKVYCQNGCVSGTCVDLYHLCVLGDYDCNGQNLVNCTLSDNGNNVWTPVEFCDYGCEFTYSGGSVTGASCQQVGDSHGVFSSIEDGRVQLGFIFEPIIVIAYLVGISVLIYFFGNRINNYSFSLYMFIAFVAGGMFWSVSPGVPIIPLHIGLILIVFTSVIKIYGVFND